MNDDFSACESQKTRHGPTPFDQIKDHEQREAERVARELAVFERERQDVRKSAQEAEEAAVAHARESARKELQMFREQGIQEVLAKGEAVAAEMAAALRKDYSARAPAVIQHLVHEALAPSSPLLSA